MVDSDCDVQVFLTAREVEDSLAGRDLTKCLSWCHENRSRLRKLKSSLEFQVRLQEYLELVKAGQRLEAVKHAKKFLSPESELEHSCVVQQAMGLLAFPTTTSIQPYKDLLDPGRWKSLISQFRTENFRLHQLSSQSMFTVALQSGLAALKTPQCYKHNFLVSGQQRGFPVKHSKMKGQGGHILILEILMNYWELSFICGKLGIV